MFWYNSQGILHNSQGILYCDTCPCDGVEIPCLEGMAPYIGVDLLGTFSDSDGCDCLPTTFTLTAGSIDPTNPNWTNSNVQGSCSDLCTFTLACEKGNPILFNTTCGISSNVLISASYSPLELVFALGGVSICADPPKEVILTITEP